jgi:hypothetical protein
MKDNFPSLITPDAQTGLALAGQMADSLHAQIEQASARGERPGGMNYLLPSPVTKETVAGILFYAIAAANRCWASKV